MDTSVGVVAFSLPGVKTLTAILKFTNESRWMSYTILARKFESISRASFYLQDQLHVHFYECHERDW
ncbi:hypothetical protein H4Q26_006169 [Puccinia striiformis f. sp. tritici PST-130]|nr:hypothetical protein H4Q26_006169 [Puccinia striiformis f. sp. tritici PST-130]